MDGCGDRLCVRQSVLLTLAVHVAEPRRQLQGGQPSSCLLNAQHQGGWGRGGQGLVERGRGEVPSRVEFGPGAVCFFVFFLGGGGVEDCVNGWKRNPDSAASIHVSTPTHLMRARPNGSSCAS